MFCYKCGAEISDGAKFCHKCGAKVPSGDVSKEISVPSHITQKQENSVLSEELHQGGAVMNEQNIEQVRGSEADENFKEFINKHVRENTKFQSAEELLNSKVPQKFLWICFGVPAICLLFLFIQMPTLEIIGMGLALFLIFVYPIALLIDTVLSLCVNRGEFKTNGSINEEELILFLNRNLSYLSPYFNEWDYIKMVGYGVRGMAVAAVQNSLMGTRIGTEFGRRKSCFVEIHISPDHANLDSGQFVYFFSTAIRSLWPAKYVCKVKAVPILQAAMEYYLKEYRTDRNDVSTVIENPKTNKEPNYATQQTLDKRTIPGTTGYGDNIKPYYHEQFERIAHGQKAKFNWAAFFLNGWMQLYNGCSKVFYKTFLPWLLAYFMVSLIRIVSISNLNMTLMWITSVLTMLLGIGGFALSIVNGFKFNEWFYRDVIGNPGKERSKKGVWILIAAEIIAMGILFLLPKVFVPSYDGLINDLDIELPEEDTYVMQSENSTTVTQPEPVQSVTADEAARLIEHWLIDYPIYPDFQRVVSPSLDGEAFDDEGNDSWEFELWIDGEEFARILVNKEDGDVIIEYLVWNENKQIFTSNQMPIDQWYTSVYQVEAGDNMYADEDEEIAKQVLLEWFDRHPLMQDIGIQPMDEYAESDDGKYLIYEMHMGQEGYGVLYVNPNNGDMVMDSIIDDYGNETSIQIPIEQWYLEYYWGWTDDSGYYLEQYLDDLYIIYDETDIEILEYHVSDDRYFICNWDGNCSVEYVDGIAKSTYEVGIMELVGTFGCDMSFEVEGQLVNFYYSLQVDWDNSYFIITEMWRGNMILEGSVGVDRLAGNTLTFDALTEDGTGYEAHYLTYIPAKDSPLGEDLIYIDGDETMPFVRE